MEKVKRTKPCEEKKNESRKEKKIGRLTKTHEREKERERERERET